MWKTILIAAVVGIAAVAPAAELDAEKQSAIWKEAQIALLKDAAVVPAIRLKYVFPMKSYVDLGHPLEFSWSTYSPQVTEKTRILAH